MNIAYQSLKRVGYPIFKPKLTEVRGVEHLPRQGGFILAANHIDWLDGFYIAAAIGIARDRPVYFLTKSNYYWWTSLAVQIPSDRRSGIIDTAVANLKRGKIICNFIEGQRNTATALLPGKTGTVRMALQAGVPIVPLGITCRPGKNMAESIMYLFSNKQSVKIRIGRAINFGRNDSVSLSLEQLRDATTRVMRAIAPLAGKRY